MPSIVTRDVLESYLYCKYKGWLKLSGQEGSRSDYEALLTESSAEVRIAAVQKLVARQACDDVARNVSLNAAFLRQGKLFIFDSAWEDHSTSLLFDGLKKVPGPSNVGDHHYIPMLFHDRRPVRREEKLLAELYGLFLSRLQDKAPASAIIWYGTACRMTRVQLAHGFSKGQHVLQDLRELQNAGPPPGLILNDHCQICEFRQTCHNEALKDDNLSLLRGMGEKEIRKHNRKGILTTTQLSCTFRPRRRGKRVRNPGPIRYYSLQALAIRDAKTYVYGVPTVPTAAAQVYFDIEGDPDRGFAYLLGAIVVTAHERKQYSFWADDSTQEMSIFQQFALLMDVLKDVCIYHYGTYESAFLKRMRKQTRKKTLVDTLLRKSVNVLSLIRPTIYFPTYTNGLKDIANYLGFAWTDSGATGLQSIVWRTQWERTHDDDLKRRLIQYNLEDCAALAVVTGYLRNIAAMANDSDPRTDGTGQAEIAWANDIPMQSSRRDWGGPDFALQEFDYINKCAYFDYQRDKVFVRTNSRLRKVHSLQAKRARRPRKCGKQYVIRSRTCPFCKGRKLKRFEGQAHVKAAFDLKITSTGVVRRSIECVTATHQCMTCGKRFLPSRYKRRDKHLHALKSWAVYQHVVHRVSFQSLEAMLDECFDLRVSYQELHMIKSLMATHYQVTYRGILKKLVSGDLIHADETHANLQKGKGYVWVLTNLEEVVYLFKPTREGEFLHDLLKGFRGVLVSDFFSAYDSLPCEQQKCLIHLIRDLNHDLLGNPFDDEFKSLAQEFARLLRLIIATVDRYGLKKNHLHKHIKDVDRFFKGLSERHFRSDVAGGYHERLVKNRERLFTFLKHDGVPWNNNNAEHAVKYYARYRMIADGKMTATGLADYLVLLSIYQTCKYKGVSFLKFLLSRESDIDTFCQTGLRKYPGSRLEVYPKGFPHMYGPKGKRGQPRKKSDG